jgi:putative transcriptional regulator
VNKSILEMVHQDVRDLHAAGLLDTVTLREFDALCLPRVRHYSPAQIRRIRLRARASQGVFAACLNTSVSTVQKWEQGVKRPTGPSLKLLELVDRKGLEVLL